MLLYDIFVNLKLEHQTFTFDVSFCYYDIQMRHFNQQTKLIYGLCLIKDSHFKMLSGLFIVLNEDSLLSTGASYQQQYAEHTSLSFIAINY